jgi:hypothetical protein
VLPTLAGLALVAAIGVLLLSRFGRSRGDGGTRG